MYSIQNRILLGLAVIFTVSTLVLLGWTWSTTSHEVEELYDASLVQVTRQFSDQLTLAPDLSNLAALRAAMKRTEANRPQISSHDDEYEEAYEGQRYGLNDDDPGHHYEHHLSIQVWHADGRLLLSSPETLQLPAPEKSGLDTQFSTGSALRTYTLYRPDDQLWVRGGQPLSLRAEMSNEVAEHVLLPLACRQEGFALRLRPKHHQLAENGLHNAPPQELVFRTQHGQLCCVAWWNARGRAHCCEAVMCAIRDKQCQQRGHEPINPGPCTEGNGDGCELSSVSALCAEFSSVALLISALQEDDSTHDTA